MPRQSRTDRLLAERERLLEQAISKATAEVERLNSVLFLVRDFRKELSAAPKRSRAKRTTAPANDGVTTTA